MHRCHFDRPKEVEKSLDTSEGRITGCNLISIAVFSAFGGSKGFLHYGYASGRNDTIRPTLSSLSKSS